MVSALRHSMHHARTIHVSWWVPSADQLRQRGVQSADALVRQLCGGRNDAHRVKEAHRLLNELVDSAILAPASAAEMSQCVGADAPESEAVKCPDGRWPPGPHLTAPVTVSWAVTYAWAACCPEYYTRRGCEKIGTGTFATADFPGISPFRLGASSIFSQPRRYVQGFPRELALLDALRFVEILADWAVAGILSDIFATTVRSRFGTTCSGTALAKSERFRSCEFSAANRPREPGAGSPTSTWTQRKMRLQRFKR